MTTWNFIIVFGAISLDDRKPVVNPSAPKRQVVDEKDRKTPTHREKSKPAPLKSKVYGTAARVKSQSDVSDAIQEINDASRNFREVLQVTQYRHALKQANISLAEHYINGELAMIFDIVFQRESGGVWAISRNGVRIPGNHVTFLIFDNNIHDVAHSGYWDEQPVFVRNVQIVKHLNKTISTDHVRSYVGDNPIKKFRTENVYFSSSQSGFYIFPSLPSRKFGVLIKLSRGVPFDGSEVGVLNGNAQIVNRVSDNERHSDTELGHIGRGVRDYLAADWFVAFEGGNVGVFQARNDAFKIRDVFIGPFNFVSGCGESVAHGERNCTVNQFG